MRKLFIAVILMCAFAFPGCTSRAVNDSGNPLNRSILLDGGLKIGLDIPIIPIPLPKIDLNFKFHYRRPTPREEMELNLSKLGRQLEEHNQVPKDKLRSSPKPFKAMKKRLPFMPPLKVKE